MSKYYLIGLAALAMAACTQKQEAAPEEEINDSTTPLHLLTPDYKTPYGQLNADSVKADVDRVFAYINAVTPAKMTDGKVNQGTYRLTSYEWGVMYDALLDAAAITGRQALCRLCERPHRLPGRRGRQGNRRERGRPTAPSQRPRTLDDAGAMAGAWMRAAMADSTLDIAPYIENYWKIVETTPVHLPDGTIARNRPHYNAVWLDDMFMALPSMAVRSQYANDPKQLDDAANIATGFFKRMWMPEKNIFRHGYVEGEPHQPSMAWGRANGWAILTMSQLLDFLPENHPKRAEILGMFQKHAAGLAELQGIDGFWHQLLDRPETYNETSATAIFAYCLAHGINQGWLDATTYGPVAQLAWEAVASKINEKGEVEDVCVGTGMGFDPAYYAYRPVSVKAAHGYGPTIWAGAEMIKLLNTYHPYVNDSAVHYYKVDPEATTPLFSLDANGKAQDIRH